MSEIEKNKDHQIECLLADFVAIKSEISRRSNLQRVVIATFVAASAYIVQKALSGAVSYLWVLVIWLSSAMSLTFYFREHLEIHRLGELINNAIAMNISTSIAVSHTKLFPSESESDKINSRHTKSYDNQFNWIIFFWIPLTLSAYILSTDLNIVHSICSYSLFTLLVFTLSLIAFGRTLWLLFRHSR